MGAFRWYWRVLVSIAPLSIGALLCPSTAADDGDLLIVVNREQSDRKEPGGSVTLFDRDSLARLAELEIGHQPVWAGAMPGDVHLYVVNAGKSRQWTEGSLDVIDLAKREHVASVPLPTRPNSVVVPPAGDAMFVLSLGFKSRQATLTRFNRRTHSVSGEIALGPPLGSASRRERQIVRFSASGTRLFVLRVLEAPEPSRLAVIDLVDWKLVHDHELAPNRSRPVAAREGRFIYVLCRGKKAGELFVFDGDTGALVTSIEAGVNPILKSSPDESRVLLAGRRAGERDARLVAFEGAKVVGETPLSSDALQIAGGASADQVLVLSDRGITRIDASTWKAMGTTYLSVRPARMVVADEHDRVFVVQASGLSLVAVDLERGRVLRTVQLRKSKLLSKVAGTVAGVLFGLTTGLDPGIDSLWDRIGPTLALTRDERHVIVFDREMCLVSVVDAAELTVEVAVDTGDGCIGIRPLQDGAYYVAPSYKYLTVIDDRKPLEMQRHKIGRLPGEPRLFLDETRGEIWIPRKNSALAVHDLATGKTVTRIEGLPRPEFVLTWSASGVADG